MTGRERLIFKSVSGIAGNEKIGLINLSDTEEERLISIVCEWETARAIELRQSGRTNTHTTIADVMAKMIKDTYPDLGSFSINITGLKDEQYQTYILGPQPEQVYRIKASDAVLMSILTAMPIYIDSNLFRKQSIRNRKQTDKVSVPINIVNTSLLEKSLKRAIEEEDYEMASKIHDELERRKKDSGTGGKTKD